MNDNNSESTIVKKRKLNDARECEGIVEIEQLL